MDMKDEALRTAVLMWAVNAQVSLAETPLLNPVFGDIFAKLVSRIAGMGSEERDAETINEFTKRQSAEATRFYEGLGRE